MRNEVISLQQTLQKEHEALIQVTQEKEQLQIELNNTLQLLKKNQKDSSIPCEQTLEHHTLNNEIEEPSNHENTKVLNLLQKLNQIFSSLQLLQLEVQQFDYNKDLTKDEKDRLSLREKSICEITDSANILLQNFENMKHNNVSMK